jgi:beta-1,3-galactosyltransferase 1
VLPHENTTILEPENICTALNEPLFLLIVVCSSAKNFEARETIRETWANETKFNYPYFARFHSHRRGEFLNISSNEWADYVTQSSSTSSTNSSRHVIENQNIRVKVVFLLGETDFVRRSTTRQVGESTVEGFSFEEEEVDEVR